MYEKQQELVDQVIEQMEICADMLGSPDKSKESAYGFTPGLNEVESEERLRERIRNITQGIFQVMFTGAFDSGKSTLLNALMRTDVLATGNLPLTAVITKIIFKAEDEYAVIYKKEQDENGQPVTLVMKLSEFFKEYHVDHKDTEKFRKLVDHVVIYQKSDGIAGSMVQLVDSPGTRASQADDEVALDFADKADALVFMINAELPLDMHDKRYIAEHFAGKQRENVFFVVNKINLKNSDEDVNSLKEYVQEELRAVFTDKNGTFNQKLYQNRVFYVDAFGSMNTRMGRETPVTRNYKVMIPDDTTGIPEFEASLGAYLTSGDRDKTALSAYRGQMADFYMLAEKSMKNQLGILKEGKEAIEAKLAGFQKDKQKIEREIQDISDDIDATRRDILRDARDVYDSYLEAVENDWSDYFIGKTDEMGVSTVRLLAAKAGSKINILEDKAVREEKLEERTGNITQNFTAGIEGFMKIKSKEMEEQFSIKLHSRMNELEEKLDRHQANLEGMKIPIDINEIIRMISREYNINIPGMEKNNAKLGQALVAFLLADPEIVVTAAGGKAGTTDFIVDLIKTNILDVIVTSILTSILGPIGLVYFIGSKFVKAGLRKEEITENRIAETMNMIINGGTAADGNAIEGLKKEGKAKFIASTEDKIGGAMRRASHALTKGIKDRLSAIERQLSEAYAALAANENALGEETERMNHILDTFAKAVSDMSVLTNGTPLSVDDIREFSTQSEEQ